MKRLLLSLLIAIPSSLVIAVLLFFASAFAGGACHCMTPVSVFFPYGTFITMRTRFETAGFYCDLLQFPLYATVIAALNNWEAPLGGRGGSLGYPFDRCRRRGHNVSLVVTCGGATQQIVGPEPREATIASSLIRLICSVAPRRRVNSTVVQLVVA